MIMKLVYKILNIKTRTDPAKMKWVWVNIMHKENESNKYVDMSKKMW